MGTSKIYDQVPQNEIAAYTSIYETAWARGRALRRPCGKSFEFNGTIESALSSLAQRQKESSLGSGEISIGKWSLTSSARSRIRLTTRPIRCGRSELPCTHPEYLRYRARQNCLSRPTREVHRHLDFCRERRTLGNPKCAQLERIWNARFFTSLCCLPEQQEEPSTGARLPIRLRK